MKLTKKQMKLNAKLRHMQTETFKKKQARKELKRLDKEWRHKVKEEFGHKCAICGRTDIIHCHHLFAREMKELRHYILNGICLCPLHHKYSTEISAHKNPIAFLEWYQKNYAERYKLLLAFKHELIK